MAGQDAVSESTDSFEYMLFEGDPDHLKTVVSTPNQISPWIDPSVLKLTHRIGRGPFGDVWIATRHQCAEDYDQYHEVAVKMLYPMKDDQTQDFLDKFGEIFPKCQGLENVCILRGISIQNGRVCIVMKYYEGSVGDKMAHLKGGRIPLSDVLRYGVELAKGILQLHSMGILVLNLKPCNVLLDKDDTAILGDIGMPSLLLPRLGTPNYMAPEQYEPTIRGPISFETDSWGFGCSIVEMLSGIQPWRGKSLDEIHHLVVTKQEKPNIPSSLPPELENILFGCFDYDFRCRPLMADILHVFKSCQDAGYSDSSWADTGHRVGDKSARVGYTDWSLLKDHLQIGDMVRSRKPKNSCRPESMVIPEGNVVGMESDGSFVLVRVHGFHDPLRVHSTTVERLTNGFAVGDFVRVKEEDKKHSAVGVLHSIQRDGRVTVGFIGMETLREGSISELQMAETYNVGQFLRLKANITSPRFEWPRKMVQGEWAVGRISQVLPNGCLVVKFPGRFSLGEASSFLADPSEVEVVSFSTCEGVVKKYQHIEDFHWAVRPLLISLGIFTALKVGFMVGKSMGRPMRKKGVINVAAAGNGRQQQQDVQNSSSSSNPAWLPPSVANILFREGAATPAS